MTALYRPVLIDYPQQAAALPVGTFAVRWDIPWIAEKRGPDDEGATWWESKNGIYDDLAMLRTTALVPIDTPEEHASSQIHITYTSPPAPQQIPVRMPCPKCGLR